MHRRILRHAAPALALVVVLGWGSSAGDAASAAAEPAADLQGSLSAALRSAALGPDVSVAVSRDGVEIFGHDADERQIPASTMKLVTATTALATLGAERRFATRVVHGNDADQVVLVGGGDPLLTRGDIARLARKTAESLKSSRVTSVEIAVDDFLFPRPSEAEGWAPGDSPTYASAVRALGFFGDYSSDTAAPVVRAFVQGVEQAGIDVRLGGRTVAGDDAGLVAATKGGRLSEAIEVMLRVSENNVAENLFRHVALAQGYPATWSGAQSAAREVLQSLDLRTHTLRLVDGSGLSAKDRLTATTLTQILDRIVDPAYAQLAPILDWLPVAGRTGTLSYRFNGEASCARDEVYAKTGSLTGVNTLAGLTKGPDGRWLSFAVMVNHRPMGYPNTSTSSAIDVIAAKVNGCA